MTAYEWIGLVSAVVVPVVGAVGWMTRAVNDAKAHARRSLEALGANLRHEMAEQMRSERTNADRVYAMREHVSRLEARLDGLESMMRDVRDTVHGIAERLDRSR